MGKWFSLLLLVALAGCVSLESRVVGTWRVKGVDASTTTSAMERAAARFASPVIEGTTFEFNEGGRVKVSHALGSGAGTYRFEGGKVLVMLSEGDKEPTFRFQFASDGTLVSVREFESDLAVVLARVER